MISKFDHFVSEQVYYEKSDVCYGKNCKIFHNKENMKVATKRTTNTKKLYFAALVQMVLPSTLDCNEFWNNQ